MREIVRVVELRVDEVKKRGIQKVAQEQGEKEEEEKNKVTPVSVEEKKGMDPLEAEEKKEGEEKVKAKEEGQKIIV